MTQEKGQLATNSVGVAVGVGLVAALFCWSSLPPDFEHATRIFTTLILALSFAATAFAAAYNVDYFRGMFNWALVRNDFPTFRLNGWQRIGVVLSCLWVLFFSFIVAQDYEEHVRLHSGSTRWTHYHFSDGNFSKWKVINESIKIKPAEINSSIGKADSGMFDDLPIAAGWVTRDLSMDSGIPLNLVLQRQALRVQWGSVMAWLIFPIVNAWLAAYGLIHLIRWLVAGFKRNAE